MKKKLLFILFLNILFCANAQTETFTIDWSFGSNPNASGDANADRTIEAGDTVIWNWYASGTHNVVSLSTATESFDSGLLGPGSTFSYTFTQVGTNDYVCTPHSGSMFGTITVVPDGSLNTQELSFDNAISLYPNPARNQVKIETKLNFSSNLTISVFNTLGQKVKDFNKNLSNGNTLDISDLNPGLYFFRLVHQNEFTTQRLVIN